MTATVLLGAGLLTALVTVPIVVLLGPFVTVGVIIGGSAWGWASVLSLPTIYPLG